MNVYCVMSGEARTDLDHVVYASTSKADAEMFAYKYEFYDDYSGIPYIEVLDVVESEDKMADIELVIKIPEGTKEQIIALTNLGASFPPKLQERIVRAIINGTPLDNEKILDKIRDKIMQLGYEVEVVDYDHNDITRIKKAHWIIREEVLWIIDKYKKAVRIDDKNIDNKL